MKRRLLTTILVLFILMSQPILAMAQASYLFGVPSETVDVYWYADGSESIEYTFVFANQAGAHPIDFVDVGMPNGNFNIGTAQADVNGTSVSVSQSDYQGSGSGFAVVMGSQTIPAGASGTVHVLVKSITQVLYPDSNDNNYASGDFAPTYFGSQYVVGSTDLSVTFHLPPGVKPEEPRWHASPSGFPSQPETAIDSQNSVTYTWRSANANASSQYTFGASFPKQYVPDSAIVQTSMLDIFIGFFTAIFSFVAGSLPCLIVIFIFFGVPILNAIQGQRRKLQYLPPKVAIEGHGIKRGLTAVEAAILMEQPLDKIMTMILFGVIKKNAAEVVTRDPLAIKSTSPVPDGLHEYELSFLKSFQEENAKTRQGLLQETMVKLVRSVSEKMKGFSRNETSDYYKAIMEKAWQQIEQADTPEVKSQKFDESLEWTMLDKNYDDRTRRVFTGPVYMPMWWGHYNPTYSSRQTGSSIPTSVPSQSSGRPTLPGADFAAQVVTGVQTFSQKVVGDVTSFTERVTGATNPPPKPTSSGRSSGGGGGRSCACACACAGCACACAGGGR